MQGVAAQPLPPLHLPAMHVLAPEQRALQSPQCSLLVWRFTQERPHCFVVEGHEAAHELAAHTSAAPHGLVQWPQ